MFHDDLFDPLANITHRSNLVRSDWAVFAVATTAFAVTASSW
jgi:hypothetical protein